MLLYRVYILRQDELATERAYLIEQMQDQSQNAFASAAKVSMLATVLQQNAAADHRTYQRFAWAVYFGVSHTAALLQLFCCVSANLRCLDCLLVGNAAQ